MWEQGTSMLPCRSQSDRCRLPLHVSANDSIQGAAARVWNTVGSRLPLRCTFNWLIRVAPMLSSRAKLISALLSVMSASACSIGLPPVTAANCSVKTGLGDITLAWAELSNHSSWQTATDITVTFESPTESIPYQFQVLLKPGETKKALAINQFPVDPYAVFLASHPGRISGCVTMDVRFSSGPDWERGPPL